MSKVSAPVVALDVMEERLLGKRSPESMRQEKIRKQKKRRERRGAPKEPKNN